jgi:NAD(P)H-hydrate epimerase
MVVTNLTSWKSGVSPEQMREIDRAATEDYGILPLQLMEVAGLATARVGSDLVGPPLSGRRVSILAGPGNNGGDGLVAARRLAGWGAEVTALTSYPLDAARGLSGEQVRSALESGVLVQRWPGRLEAADLVIDALLGFGAQGAPRGVIAEMISATAAAGTAVLALDLPSGLDAGSGAAAGGCVVATATVTLALPKKGLLSPAAQGYVGRLFLADIGVPLSLLVRHNIDVAGLFEANDIVEIVPFDRLSC